MGLTERETAELKVFSCVRVSALTDAAVKLRNFQNDKGNEMVADIKQNGIQNDKAGEHATYLIIDNQNNVCCFFSLRCGILFQSLHIDEVSERIKKFSKDLDDWRNGKREIPIIKRAKKMNYTENKAYKLARLQSDTLVENNINIHRVASSTPAVELSHFCINENYRDAWNEKNISQRMGESFFYYFIIPKINELCEIAGCRMVYLFAADGSEQQSLLKYYTDVLHFRRPEDPYGAVKSSYDYSALLLIQEITEMNRRKNEFFGGEESSK